MSDPLDPPVSSPTVPATLPPPRAFEFDATQDAAFTGLADAMKPTGTILLALGIVALLSTVAIAALGIARVMHANDLLVARESVVLSHTAEISASMRDAMQTEIEREKGSILPYVVGAILGIIGSLIPVTMGRALRRAAGAFRAVATSKGHDVERVMEGISELSGVYSVGRILVIYAITLAVITTVFTMRALGPH